MKNFVKEKMEKGQVSVGTMAHIGSPEIPEMLCKSGFEWIIFDNEHGPTSIETTQNLIQAMDKDKCLPFVRVAWNDPVLIKRALDIGAYGVLVPWINNANEAKKVVEACRYPPRGIRGFGPRRCSMYGSEMKDYLSTVEDELLIMVQIETVNGLKNIEEIANVDGINLLFLGPGDLAVSINGVLKIGETTKTKEFLKNVEKIVEVSKKAGVIPGCACDVDQFKERKDQGFKFIDVMADEMIFMYGCQSIINKVKEGQTGGIFRL